MAIKRQNTNPVIVLDSVVSDVVRDVYTDRETGVVTDKGRKLVLQTGAPNSDLLEVKVPEPAFSGVVFVPGEHVLINAEYLEWDMDGRRGSTMRFHSFVTVAQVEGWRDIASIGQATTAAATA